MREVEYQEFMDHRSANRSISALKDGPCDRSNRKVEKDQFGYVFVKPTQTTSVLKEVILSQKEKILKMETEHENMVDELKVREEHIKKLQ